MRLPYKISVIVPVYKVEPYLARCVDSILAQTYQDLEVILVDDGSPDRCGEICDEYGRKDPRVRVVHKENGGLSSARNAGLEIASGDCVAFVDSDDSIAPDMYELLAQAMERYHAPMVCCGRYDVYGERTVPGLCPAESRVTDTAGFLAALFAARECDVSCCDKLFRRALFENVRYPVGEINEDAAVIHLLAHAAKTVAFLDRPLYYYYHRENSISTSPFSVRQLIVLDHTRAIVDFTREHYPDLADAAEGYYNKLLLNILSLLAVSDKQARRQNAALYREKITELKSRKRYLSGKDKKRYLVLKTRTYRFYRRLRRLLGK